MAEYTIVQIKRDSTLNWYASNPRLALGEPGVDMDLHRFKIGNGIDRWNELPYMDDDLYKLLDKQQQATADYVQDLLNKIAANKLDADQKYNALTSEVRNTSRSLTDRMTAVETGQTEYQKNLTERQQEFEEAVTGDFEDTKSEVQAGLDEFNETRDSLTVRMNVIAGQTTEDTEILDARVDAKNHTHPNLGENIRNIHSEVLSLKQSGAEEKEERIAVDEAEKAARITADETEKAERIAADETEKTERTAAYETERAERITIDEQHEAEIAKLSDNTEKLSEHGEFLQEQANANAEGLFTMQVLLSSEIKKSRGESERLDEETEARKQKDTEISDALEHEAEARVQTDTEIKAVQQEHYQEFLSEQEQRRSEDARLDAELSAMDSRHSECEEELAGSIQENTASTREKISAHAEYLQEQTDELAGLVASEMLQNRKNLRAVQEDIQLEAHTRSKIDAQIREKIAEVDEEHDIKEVQIILNTADELSSARQKTSEATEHLQEQADILAAELQRANISSWKKTRELDAKDKRLHEEITDAKQRLHAETEETAAAIRQEIQNDAEGLGRNLTRRDEHLQEQADELAGAVVAEAIERQKDKQEFKQKVAGTEEKLEGLVSDEALLREKKDAELTGEIALNAKHDALKDDYLQEQADQNAQANIQMARSLLQETEYRRRDIQNVHEEISSEKLERARDIDSVKTEHSADISRLEDADSVAAKIRHDEDSGLQKQINELADLRIRDALESYKERLQAKADKQHDDIRQQAEKENQTNQINDLADGVLGVILYVCQACKKLRVHIKLIENALVDWGVLDNDDIPPMTETEIDDMIDDIFSGNTSGGEIEPDDEDEAEFLEDINNIFNP